MKDQLYQRKAYKLEEIAEIYDIPLATLRGWHSKNLFPRSKRGKKVWVNIQEFDKWLLDNPLIYKH